MTEIQGGRWDSLLRRLFPVKGQPVSPAVAPEIQPVVIAQQWEPNLYYLRSERMGIGHVEDLAGGAGTFSKVMLYNPASSGFIVQVERVVPGCSNQVQFRMGSSLIGTAGGAKYPRDTRWVTPTGVGTGLVAQLRTLTDATSPGSLVGKWDQPLGVAGLWYADLPWPIVLGEDAWFLVQCPAAQTEVRAGFHWVERLREPSEAAL